MKLVFLILIFLSFSAESVQCTFYDGQTWDSTSTNHPSSVSVYYPFYVNEIDSTFNTVMQNLMSCKSYDKGDSIAKLKGINKPFVIDYYVDDYAINFDGVTYSWDGFNALKGHEMPLSNYYKPLNFALTGRVNNYGTLSSGKMIANMDFNFIDKDYYGTGFNKETGLDVYVYAASDVIFKPQGCDFSSKNVIVNLPDYPGSSNFNVYITCPSNLNVNYYLTGITEKSDPSIFLNSSSFSPAKGVGVKISDKFGIISANTIRNLGVVGKSGTSINLTATYARTNEKITAGNVQSLIGLTLQYP